MGQIPTSPTKSGSGSHPCQVFQPKTWAFIFIRSLHVRPFTCGISVQKSEIKRCHCVSGNVAEENALPPEVPRRRNLLSNLTNPAKSHLNRISISGPQDFRRVSAIVDVDIIPETQRRVKLLKHNTDKPLGFYIRDGTSVRVTPSGLEKVPGIFISRLVPGGLAESTGLLAVNDEVLEVNGIEVAGKTLDQVTDMMIANSHNLIITVKPSNQFNNPVIGRFKHAEPDRSKSQSLTNLATHSVSPALSAGSPTMHHAYHNELAEEIPDSDEEEHPTVDEDGILSI